MMEVSQCLDLKNYLKEVQLKHKPDFFLEDVVTGTYANELYANELFEKAKPADYLKELYDEEYKPEPHKQEKEKPDSKTKKRKEPPEFKLPKIKPAPSTPRYLPGNYDAGFEKRVEKYSSTYGRELTNHLRNQGRSFYKLEKIGTTQTMPGNAALVAKVGDRTALIGSSRFGEEVENFAQAYGVPSHLAERYILDHEYTHLSQSPLDTITAELDVENTLKNFYLAKAIENPVQNKEYLALARIPMLREHQVANIYSKAA